MFGRVRCRHSHMFFSGSLLSCTYHLIVHHLVLDTAIESSALCWGLLVFLLSLTLDLQYLIALSCFVSCSCIHFLLIVLFLCNCRSYNVSIFTWWLAFQFSVIFWLLILEYCGCRGLSSFGLIKTLQWGLGFLPPRIPIADLAAAEVMSDYSRLHPSCLSCEVFSTWQHSDQS